MGAKRKSKARKQKAGSKKFKGNLNGDPNPDDAYVDFSRKSEVERNPGKFDVGNYKAAVQQPA